MTYTLTNGTSVIRDADGLTIPADALNADWQTYQAWLAAGNTATDYAAPAVPVPQSLSRRQFFQQAAVAGIISQAEALAAVAGTAIPAALQTALNKLNLSAGDLFNAQMLILGASSFQRSNPFVVQLGPGLNMTSAQLDQYWTAGAAL